VEERSVSDTVSSVAGLTALRPVAEKRAERAMTMTARDRNSQNGCGSLLPTFSMTISSRISQLSSAVVRDFSSVPAVLLDMGVSSVVIAPLGALGRVIRMSVRSLRRDKCHGQIPLCHGHLIVRMSRSSLRPWQTLGPRPGALKPHSAPLRRGARLSYAGQLAAHASGAGVRICRFAPRRENTGADRAKCAAGSAWD